MTDDETTDAVELPTLLCKCMRDQCMNTHWADLTDAQKRALGHKFSKQDKTWPPRGMETK
jgi:hypothetical protein